MKSFDIRWTITLFILILSLSSYAGEPDSKKAIIPPDTEAAAPSRWSLSAGATVSSIKASFQADPGLVGLLGSTAIYDGTGVLVYQNGTVGPGGAGTGFVSNYTGGSYNLANDTWTYTGVAAAPGSVNDTETSVGPYIRLAYDLDDFDSNTLHLSLFGQYTFTTAFDSGNNPVTNVDTIYTTEDVKFSPLIYNAAEAGFGPGPFQTFSPSAAFVNSGLNIDMHTFELGLGLTKDLSDRVHLVFFTGPTLNLFETGLSSSVLGVLPIRSDNSAVCFGWDGQLGLQFDLDSNKRWFIETLGNYHWVTPFSVSTPISSAKVQASSWSAELGLGYRF